MDPFGSLFRKHAGFFEKTHIESVLPQSIQPRRYDFYVQFKRAGTKRMQTVWAFNIAQALQKFMAHHWPTHKRQHPAKTSWAVKEIVYDQSKIETSWYKGADLYAHWPTNFQLN